MPQTWPVVSFDEHYRKLPLVSSGMFAYCDPAPYTGYIWRLHLESALVLSELDFNFFFGAPLLGTVMGSKTSLNSSQSTSGTYGNTGPYILPSFVPTFGRIVAAS